MHKAIMMKVLMILQWRSSSLHGLNSTKQDHQKTLLRMVYWVSVVCFHHTYIVLGILKWYPQSHHLNVWEKSLYELCVNLPLSNLSCFHVYLGVYLQFFNKQGRPCKSYVTSWNDASTLHLGQIPNTWATAKWLH